MPKLQCECERRERMPEDSLSFSSRITACMYSTVHPNNCYHPATATTVGAHAHLSLEHAPASHHHSWHSLNPASKQACRRGSTLGCTGVLCQQPVPANPRSLSPARASILHSIVSDLTIHPGRGTCTPAAPYTSSAMQCVHGLREHKRTVYWLHRRSSDSSENVRGHLNPAW